LVLLLVFLFCSMIARMKKQSYSCIVLIIALAIALLSAPLLDRLLLPWAFEHANSPALTGSWVGSLTTATGHQRGVVLELRLPEPKGEEGLVRDWHGAPYGELEGTARVCDELGQIHSYTLEGEPENRQATRLSLYATPSESPVPEGLTLSWMNGTWDHANRIELKVQFYWEQDGSSISGGGYPDTQTDATLALTRGGDAEFQALCAGLPHSNYGKML
jgi:hypothetical protein